MEAATWNTCRADFAFDGALVDLLAPGTGPAEWESFWSALRAGPFGLRAFRDGKPIPRPSRPPGCLPSGRSRRSWCPYWLAASPPTATSSAAT